MIYIVTVTTSTTFRYEVEADSAMAAKIAIEGSDLSPEEIMEDEGYDDRPRGSKKA